MDEKCILDPQRDCIGKAEAAKLEGRIKALEEWKEDSKKFHTDFYQWQNKQAVGDVLNGTFIIPSSTPGSEKKFRVSVDDSGTITTTEVTTT